MMPYDHGRSEKAKFENKITVRVWLPTHMGFIGKAAKAIGVGHASITLKVGGEKYYITWMADGSPFAGRILDPYPKIDEFSREGDKVNMMNFFNCSDPTYKFKLPTLQFDSDPNAIAVDPYKILLFWEDRLHHMPKYSFLSTSKNCTGCVADALRAGGLDNFVPFEKPWFVQDAGSLVAWLLKVQKRIGGDQLKW